MDKDNPDWLIVKRRIDPEQSARFERIMLKPDVGCTECNGTGISKYTYDCGARNCAGHNDIICGCRELQLHCPYQADHPNTFGNWSTKSEKGMVYVECYNVADHQKNPDLSKFVYGNMRTIRFDVVDLNAVHDPDLCDGSKNCKCTCYSCKSLRSGN